MQAREPAPDHDDALVKVLYRTGLTVNRVVLRWLLNAEIPLLSAGVLLTLEPPDTPMSAGEVADAIGISVEDATRALHELRSLGYATEEKRRYLPTEKGRETHAALARARRQALAESVSRLSDVQRRDLARALGAAGAAQPD